ncbi:MAG: hypothetical protein ACI9WU_002982, partial [Myxococcota bacterium]
MNGPFHSLRDPVVGACVVGLLAVLIHLGTLSNGFVFDDIPAIVDNPVVNGSAPASEAFSRNFWGGRPGYEHVTTWRPLTSIVMRAVWATAPGSSTAFHAASMLLHGLTTALLFLLVAAWLGAPEAWVAALLFAVMPTHVEAIAGAVSLAELLTAAFYVAGLWAFWSALEHGHPIRWLAACACFFAALLSKEHGITWPAAAAVLYAQRFVEHRQAPNRVP